MRVGVISSNYPSKSFIYGDVFVHARVKQYLKQCDVKVVCHAPGRAEEDYIYEGVDVSVVGSLDRTRRAIQDFAPDALVVHFLHHSDVDYLISSSIPVVIFVHGYEATSWKRRLMNYTSLFDIRYLLPYVTSNNRQLSGLRKLIARSNQGHPIHFVFVSNWLHQAVEADNSITIRHSSVIANGIDTALFTYRRKSPDHRKKILIVRSFKAVNYANDIAIDAILRLQRCPFFSELTFAIYGEGYLFKKLTPQIAHLQNVTLHEHFVENKLLPDIHEKFGIFLCPSRLDSQGVSMCEAMSSGLVVLASPIGGIPEYVSHGKTGFLESDAEALAERIAALYHSPETFLRVSEQAAASIEEQIPIHKTVNSEIRLLKKLSGQLSEQQECVRCVLTEKDDPEISFSHLGLCNHCEQYDAGVASAIRTNAAGQQELQSLVSEIKRSGKGKRYDSIIGLSGGVDSTFLALKARELGLRPLAVHFDNGWNSELAVHNIQRIIDETGFDLQTIVIDWEEFRDLQLAFMKASVVDIEMLTDHAIIATLYRLALSLDIKFILSGVNYATEAILPAGWIHDKRDHVHIQDINRVFGTRPIKKFPLMTSWLKFRVQFAGIRSVALLNYFPYNKADVKNTITKRLGWRDYGGKHYESVFTRFYQGYILPVKFKIDKRKAHLSNLICSGQLTKQEALEILKSPAYPKEVLANDLPFVLKKLQLTNEQFDEIMRRPPVPHHKFKVDQSIYVRFPILKVINPAWRLVKKIKGLSQ